MVELKPIIMKQLEVAKNITILRKIIEGYLDSVQSLTFNTIKTKLIMHAFHSVRYLQSNEFFKYSTCATIYTENSQTFNHD